MSRATSQCTDKEIVAVANHVSACWQQFVSFLSPTYFAMAKIKVIKDVNRDNLFCQCRAALEMWTNKFVDKANRRSVIQAMCDIGYRSLAVAVLVMTW